MTSLRRCHRDGFVLLLTLALVMLAGGLLSGLAMKSASAGLQAEDSVERLQRRWAVETCRATLLQNAEWLLDDAERGEDDGDAAGLSRKYTHPPVSKLRIACRLAELDYELIFTDEQAKLNVNTLLQNASRQAAQHVVERLVESDQVRFSPKSEVELRYRDTDPTTGADDPLKVGAYGQIFLSEAPSRLVGYDGQNGLVDQLTCWSDGTVNIRRASDAVLRQICATDLRRAEIDTLIRERRKDPYQSVESLLGRMKQLDAPTQTKLKRLLTDGSASHGLWVLQHGAQRSWYALIIARGAPEEQAPESDRPSRLAITQWHEFQW